MSRRFHAAFTVLVVLSSVLGTAIGPAAAQAAGHGTIKGRIVLSGPAPVNTLIRMGADPMCGRANAGQRPRQEAVVTSPDGGLANVFITLEGTFPQTAVPATPVTIDQRGCVYAPRVVGVRVGQMVAIHNSDPLMHNVHAVSAKSNGFNVSEPKVGMVQTFKMTSAETMLRLRCEVHSWMTAYVGVVNNPYFAVSSAGGGFDIGDVPPGSYTIRAWHERYGMLTQTVRVKAGAPTTLEFTYTGKEKPSTAGVRDLQVPVPVSAPQMASR